MSPKKVAENPPPKPEFCIRPGCGKHAQTHSNYCSDECFKEHYKSFHGNYPS